MKTHGHETVAKTAGEPLLQQAFRAHFGQDVPLEAFYLGNWLTDVAQAYDPVAGAAGVAKINAGIDKAFDQYLPEYLTTLKSNELVNLFSPIDPATFQRFLTDQRAKLKETLRDLEIFLREPHAGGPPLYFKVCQNSFFFKGYLKFVHPKKGPPENVTKPLRMDMGIYEQLFQAFYTQYWPHDHMDRPELVPVPEGPGVVKYDERRPADTSPGNYTYLTEFATLAAADLADIDLNWARPYLTTSRSFESLRTDFTFQRGLANLGRALHSVEDYFAHSNYIEHAAKVMGQAYIPHTYQLIDYVRFAKRLIRLTNPERDDDWYMPDVVQEPHVVSGYFDFFDTAVSLLHLLEGPVMGILGRQPRDVTLELREIFDIHMDPAFADNVIERESDRLVSDMLEVINTPAQAYANQNNRFRQAIHQAYQIGNLTDFAERVEDIIGNLNLETPASEVNIAYYRNILKHLPLFAEMESMEGTQMDTDQLIKVYSALVLLVRYLLIRWDIHKMNFLEIIETLLLWYFLPKHAVKQWLKRVVGEYLADAVTFFAKEKFFNFVAADRIGCHSLMSKDHGNEWLYQPMQNCAMAAHYYIVKKLMRWQTGGGATIPFIDWEDVLRHIMVHPAKGVEYTIVHPIPSSVFYNLTEADMQRPWRDIFRDLADFFRPTVLGTMRTDYNDNKIILGNVPRMIRNLNPNAVKEQLVATMLFPASAPLLGIRRVLIPYIQYKVGVVDPTKRNPRWYMPLMHMNWKPGTAENPTENLARVDMRHKLRFVSSDVATARANAAPGIRLALQQRYQPPS